MAVKLDLVRKTITLGVGDLVAEALGSIGRVAGLSVWARMELGRDVHARHQRRQAELHEGYAREQTVRYQTTVDDFTVTIQGRIDGVLPAADGRSVVLEEIKSVVLPPLIFAALSAESYPHYVEQLRLYCFFIEQTEPSRAVAGRLVFINLGDQTRQEIELAGPFDDGARLIADRVRALIDTARAGATARQAQRARGEQLTFPHPAPRPFQDAMMTAVEHALAHGRHLLVSAPSGIGKTAGALHPVMKHALANNHRVFFVTAKNTQHAQALTTLTQMRSPTAVALRAREKMCINNVYACREEFCPHLQMFALKLERTKILDRLTARGVVSPDNLIEAGRGAGLCPFELGLLQAEHADAIVCDYNYVFDPQVYFRRFFQERDYADTVLVIDEAHNLLGRALDYYSPVLRRQQARDLLPHLRALEAPLAKAFRQTLGRIEDFFASFTRHAPDEYSQLDDWPAETREKFTIDSPRGFFEELRPEVNRLAVRYLLAKLTSGRAIADDPIEEFFADFGHFCSVLALEGDEFAYVFDRSDGDAVAVVCLDPARQLAARLQGFHSVIAMSATLEPLEFYRQMLGFDAARTDTVKLPSPFPRERRHIAVVGNIATTYRHRHANYGKVAAVIRTTVAARRGHYLALFPSYEFLGKTADELGVAALALDRVREQRPPFGAAVDDPLAGCRVIVQGRDMTEEARQELLDALRDLAQPKLILAVQGGVFAEGVDYAGDMLSGVIVVSPALPQVSYERELMRRYYEQTCGKGFEYAYLYPGMNRVIQSVGRLIRTETDCGVAVLICQRFRQQQYTALFPADWTADTEDLRSRDLARELQEFWSRH